MSKRKTPDGKGHRLIRQSRRAVSRRRSRYRPHLIELSHPSLRLQARGLTGRYPDKTCALWPVFKNWHDTVDGQLLRMTAEKLRSEVSVRKSRNRASSRHDDTVLGVTCTSKRSCLYLWSRAISLHGEFCALSNFAALHLPRRPFKSATISAL